METFTGTWRLVRLALRRDRIRLAIWVGGLSALMAALATEMSAEYATEAERLTAAGLLATSPSLLLLRGWASNATEGGLLVSEALVIVAVLAALMSILAVVRHTRENEERGRAELLGSTGVGRHASLGAALIVAVGASVVLGGLLAGVLIAKGLPATGALAFGAGIGATGVSFAVVAAITAQLSGSARGAKGLAAAVLGVAYLLRGLGDVLGDLRSDGTTVVSAWPAWLSPIGWAQQLRPFDENNWWVLGLSAAMLAGGAGVAFALVDRRDVGRGLLAEGRGPSSAPAGLLSPLGLAWRLQRGLLLAWAFAMVVAGAAFGSVGEQARELADNPQMAETLARLGGSGATFIDTYFAAAIALVGAVAAAYPIQALLRLRSEESDGHLEPILATAAARRSWIASHIACALAGTIGIVVLAGLSTGVAYGLTAGAMSEQVPRLTAAALVQVPAALVLAGVVIAAFGLVPRWAETVSWAAFAAALVLGPLGEVLGLPETVRNLSPFTHIPAAPAVAIALAPIALLLAFGSVLAVAGAFAFDRRDLVP